MIRLPMLLSMALLATFTLPAWGESEDNPPFSQEDLDFITAAYNLSLDQIHLADMAENREVKNPVPWRTRSHPSIEKSTPL